MDYFEQIEAMHQQVREYVEKMEPDFKVTVIDGYLTTNYAPTLASQGEFLPLQDFILTEVKARFRVHASYINKRLSCDVYMMDNGNLHTGDRLVSI